MKKFFEEYGTIIVTSVVAVTLIAIIVALRNPLARSLGDVVNGWTKEAEESLNIDTLINPATTAPVVPGATFNKEKSGSSWVNLAEPVSLTWEELKLAENGTKYGYKADKITNTSIDVDAFNGCESLTSIDIPDNVTEIEQSTFQNCTSLTSVAIGNGVTSIGYSAFYNCSGLTSVAIGNGVTSISDNAFQSCTSLTSITIPDSVTSIGKQAFFDSGLTSITIPDSVTSIGMYAFDNCPSLASVAIGNGVTSIGNGTFSRCPNLTSITIPDSVTSIGMYAFFNCSNLTDVYYTGTQAQWNAITIGSNNAPLTNATKHYN